MEQLLMSLMMDNNFNHYYAREWFGMSKLDSQPAVGFYDENCGGKAMFPHFSVIKFNWIGIHLCSTFEFYLNWVSTVAARFLYLEYLTQTEVERYSMGLKLIGSKSLTLAVPNRPSLSEILSCFRFPYHFLKGFMGRSGCVLLPFIMY